MIGYLDGILKDIGDETVILNVSGVGYTVALSENNLSKLPMIGERLELYIETIVREDMIRLYGFMSKAEQYWFNLLTSVQGIGPKGGLAVLSTHSTQALSLAISAEDTAMIARAPGVGKKVAERIIRELKDKVGALPVMQPTSSNLSGSSVQTLTPQNQSANQEAVSALVNLGFQKSEAFAIITQIEAGSETPLTTDALVRQALKRMGG